MSQISIQTTKKVIPTADNLYGTFFEDINRAGDGGLYPEMIRNRTFEDSIPPADCSTEEEGYSLITSAGWRDEFNHGEGLSRWIRANRTAYTPIPAWYCKDAKMELDTKDTLNVYRQAALDVDFLENGLIYNRGFCGIAQKRDACYRLYFFAKVSQPIQLVISIEENGQVSCRQKLAISGDAYRRYEIGWKASVCFKKAKLILSCPTGGKLKIGFISLMPTDTYKGHGLRKDLVEMLRDLHPRFFRFPGGCVVEGFTPSTAMRFRDTVGPVWERPGHQLMWHYRTSLGLGFHEYLQLCEDLQMEPLYVFNCGMTCQARCSVLMNNNELDDMIEDTLDAIEYAVGSTDSKWGRLRAEQGHPMPFRMNYVEIGNENFGPDYEKRYKKCLEAIKGRYPWMKFVANSHLEENGLPADFVDEHFYNTAEYFAENIHHYDHYDRKGPKIFVGELAVVRGYVGQLYGALGEAAFLIGAERNQDVVNMISYAPLLENIHYNAWFPNLIRFDNTISFAIPTYYLLKMFGQNRGKNVVESVEKTAVLYRPVKGTASFMGQPGLRFRNARWNGEQIEIAHELMGHVVKESDNYIITAPDELQKKANKRYTGVDLEKSFVVFDKEDAVSGTFEIEILAEKGREISLGVYSSRIPKEVYISDETNPPAEWNPSNVKPFWWKIKQSVSSFCTPDINNTKMCPDAEVFLKDGEYNFFRFEANGKTMTMFLNGEKIHQVNVPSFQAMTSVVCDTDNEVIVKAVNLSSQSDDIEISLDCDVEDEYQAIVLSNAKNAENTLSLPEKVRDETMHLSGASKHFVYRAPEYSVNVVILNKCKPVR